MFNSQKSDCGLNNLFIMKSILKIIKHVMKIPQKNFESFTSKPNAHGIFRNMHIKIIK